MGAEGVFEDADKQPHGDTTVAPAATPKGKGSRAARKTGAEAENVYATGNAAPGARVLTRENVIAQTDSVRELDVAWLYTGVPIVSREGAPEPSRAAFTATSTSSTSRPHHRTCGPAPPTWTTYCELCTSRPALMRCTSPSPLVRSTPNSRIQTSLP